MEKPRWFVGPPGPSCYNMDPYAETAVLPAAA
jgi:hypothetical protein